MHAILVAISALGILAGVLAGAGEFWCPRWLAVLRQVLVRDVRDHPIAAPPSFRWPNHGFAGPVLWIAHSKSVGTGCSRLDRSRIDPAELRPLGVGEGSTNRPGCFTEKTFIPAIVRPA
jgi:hypothetical protein